jgi:hypothetical protein
MFSSLFRLLGLLSPSHSLFAPIHTTTQVGPRTVRVAWGVAFQANGPITSYVVSTLPASAFSETLGSDATQTVFEALPSDPYIGSIQFRVTAVSAAGQSAPLSGYVVVTMNATTTTTATTTGAIQEAQASEQAVSGGSVAAIVVVLLLIAFFAALALLVVRTKSKVVAGVDDGEHPAVASEYEHFWVSEEMSIEKNPRLRPHAPPPLRAHPIDAAKSEGDEEFKTSGSKKAASYDLNQLYLAGVGADDDDSVRFAG